MIRTTMIRTVWTTTKRNATSLSKSYAFAFFVGWLGLVLVPPRTASADDLFPDKALEAAVRREVFEKRNNAEPITVEDVKNISQVVAKGKGIQRLEGLQHCKALMKIDFENNQISDLSPIRDLKSLQSIDLSNNRIESIEPLSQLLNSQYLQLSRNKISDLSPLREMKNLQSLYISENNVTSAEPLVGSKKLWTLDLSGSQIENFAPIGQLKGLQTLALKGSGVKDLEFLRNLKELKLLLLNDNTIENFSALVELAEADSKGDKRYAQFLRLFIDSKILSDPAHSAALEKLRSFGVRINPEKK